MRPRGKNTTVRVESCISARQSAPIASVDQRPKFASRKAFGALRSTVNRPSPSFLRRKVIRPRKRPNLLVLYSAVICSA